MSACQRPGCTGSYAPDGYCDECGHREPAVTSVGMAAPTGAGLGGHTTTGGTTTRGRTGTRGRLGANLVQVPPVPLRDPATAVLSDPQVPESHRYCGRCGEPVGRSRNGQPGRSEGFCPKDGTPYSFLPRLTPGELVAGRYEILGALAHGGLGWIYLARDRNIAESGAERWVVLKGLINTGDPDAMIAAMAERRFLVQVDHPNIVKIHDIAEHPDPKTGEPVGYIVMEYVGGRSLKDLALSNVEGGRRVPLPLAQVLAYAIEVLPALGYLHDHELLFCDFKPDNLIHAEEQIKLIDLGAVRHLSDNDSPLYSTPGYAAPELAAEGASVGSDLYTVGRTLAVLSFEFNGFTTRFAHRLPDPADVPLLAREESFHRLLCRSTATAVADRFASADEMAEQALGVLREVLSATDGRPRPSASARFTPERRAFGTGALDEPLDGRAVAACLPLPLVDPTDPAAPFLATLGGADPAATVAALRSAPVSTVEVSLRLVRALVEAGELGAAWDELTRAGTAGLAPGDWRRRWNAGLIALAGGDAPAAVREFDAVYGQLPGEPAAQLALAAAGELAGDRGAAGRRYERVWRVDNAFVSAAFGLARCRLADADRAGAVATLDEVPDSSSQYVAAQLAAVRARLSPRAGRPQESDLVESSGRIERLRLDAHRQATMAVEVFNTALEWLGASLTGGPPRPVGGSRVLGHALSERDVRFGLERAYRVLASLETDPLARYALVDQANAVRPRTVV